MGFSTECVDQGHDACVATWCDCGCHHALIAAHHDGAHAAPNWRCQQNAGGGLMSFDAEHFRRAHEHHADVCACGVVPSSHRNRCLTSRERAAIAEQYRFDAALLTVNEFILDDWRRAEADRGRAW